MSRLFAAAIGGLTGAVLYYLWAFLLLVILPVTLRRAWEANGLEAATHLLWLGAELGGVLGLLLGLAFQPSWHRWLSSVLGALSAGVLVLLTLPLLFDALFGRWGDVPSTESQALVQLLQNSSMVLGLFCYALPLLIIGPLAGCVMVPEVDADPDLADDPQILTLSQGERRLAA